MNNKKVIIRADGNARIGAGHLMRCLTIADAVPDKSSVAFVCADEDSAALARDRGYEAYVLHTDYADMESELPAWEKMLARGSLPTREKIQGRENVSTQEYVAAEAVDLPENREEAYVVENTESIERVILVDSYYITNTYLTSLRRFGRVIVLDDMAKTPWNADTVINYNAFANREMYEALNSPYSAKYYTGGKYIPIRKEFCGSGYVVRDVAEHILITTGGGDCDNIVGQILQRIWSEDCHYHIVTGRFNPHYDKLLKLTEEHSNIHIYHDVKNMAELMAECDLAVTAGGTTIYELSAIGVPFVCFSYAENQEKLTEYIGRNQIAGYGGAFHKEPSQTLDAIREQIRALIENARLRRVYSRKEHELVDGRGADRIAEIIGSF